MSVNAAIRTANEQPGDWTERHPSRLKPTEPFVTNDPTAAKAGGEKSRRNYANEATDGLGIHLRNGKKCDRAREARSCIKWQSAKNIEQSDWVKEGAPTAR